METVGELRKDYILDRWVIFSTGRGKRPRQFAEEPVQKESGTCFFCPGNESLTPPEIGRIEKNGKWVMRWFDNKFTALESGCITQTRTDNQFYTFGSNCGFHLVVVETPEHKTQLVDLSVEDISVLFGIFKKLVAGFEKQNGVKYVNIFKNHGASAGTSLVHSHWQVMAATFMPPLISEKVFARRKFIECPYCKIVESEKKSDRRCFENDSWVAFTPYASRFNYEIWMFPKSHARRLDDFSSFAGLADIFKKVLLKIKALGCSYNVCLQYSPLSEDLHFHIEVLPRMAIWAGFEFGSNAVINSVLPEDAAKFYRGENDG